MSFVKRKEGFKIGSDFQAFIMKLNSNVLAVLLNDPDYILSKHRRLTTEEHKVYITAYYVILYTGWLKWSLVAQLSVFDNEVKEAFVMSNFPFII